MFSPAIRKPHLLHRRDKEDASPSPPPPAVPFHSPSPHGFAVPDRPATGTPALWTPSSLLSRSRRDELLGSLYDLAKQVLEEKKTVSVDCWDVYGGDASDLQQFAKHLLGLCASSSGCERNWNTFEFIHQRLEHQRLNDLVYIKYNKKIPERFQKMRVEGNNFNPLIFDEYEWNADWIHAGAEDVHETEPENLDWALVDEVVGASTVLRGRNLPRQAHATGAPIGYHRRRRGCAVGSSSSLVEEEGGMRGDEFNEDLEMDDEEIEDDYGTYSFNGFDLVFF